LPGLWLGNRAAALDDAWLREKGIRTVFNATKDTPFSPVATERYRIPVDDNLEPMEIANMRRWGPEAVYKIIHAHRAGRPVLVHCHAGMQRSAAIVAMVLIAKRGYTVEQAITSIQGIRPIAFRPGVNFRDSIVSFYQSYQTDILPKLLHLD
jgi:protein-tyrosine phosphatase